MFRRFSPVLRFVLLLAVAAVASISIPPGAPVRAETYGEAFARVSKQLTSKNPSERASAVEALCRTDDPVAIGVVTDIIMRESDPDAAKSMGGSFKNFRADKCMDALEKRVPKMTGIANAFPALWILTGIGGIGTARADAIFTTCYKDSKEKEYFLKAATLEAIGEANKTGLNTLIEEALRDHKDDYETTGAIVPITATTTATRIASGESKFTIISALADMLDAYKSDRIKFFAAQAAAAISGSKAFYDSEYWRYWVKMKGDVSGPNAKPGRTSERNAPKFFDTEAVGKRILFVIDNSGSMQEKINVKALQKPKPPEEAKKGPSTTGKERNKGKDGKDEKEKKEPDPPDYSQVKTKFDLAKVELCYTLSQLDSTFQVNIVVYETTHDYLSAQIKGFVTADDANIKSLKEKVMGLKPSKGATNIHGALMRSFRTTLSGPVTDDPALNQEALLHGADTMFFLTDGFPTISDVSYKAVKSGSTQAQAVSNDKFCRTEGIIGDIRRVNTFRKVVIHTVGIGPHATDLLKGLANLSGGAYKDMSGA